MDSQVTLIVSPRERFSRAIPSLESICTHTRLPFRLLYVEGGLPPAVRQGIQAICTERGFELIRGDRYLKPNESRNLGIARLQTPFAVFIDNDVIVSPGWLEPLLKCAEETGAALVSPLILEGPPESGMIHVAGGDVRIVEKDGKRLLRDTYRFANTPLADVAASLHRAPAGFAEFHCMLARTDVLARVGPLDEQLTLHTELDFSMKVRDAGGSIYFEPASRVSYLNEGPYEEVDFAFFFLRWSDAWSNAGNRHFYAKWNLSMDDPDFAEHVAWLKDHRSKILKDNPAALKWLLNAEQVPEA